MIKVGFIDYYLDEWHANNYVHMLHDYSNGEVEAVYAWAEIDSPEGGLTTDAWCEKYGLTRMMTQEELIEKSDVLLVLAPRDPKKHEELANLALRSGKRCYVDKTFAPGSLRCKAYARSCRAERHAVLVVFRAAFCGGVPGSG